MPSMLDDILERIHGGDPAEEGIEGRDGGSGEGDGSSGNREKEAEKGHLLYSEEFYERYGRR